MNTIKAALLGAVFALPVAAHAAEITVTGEGQVNVAPDMASVMLGVTSEAATAGEAMAANSEQLATVLERLRAAGVEDRDLQTTGLSLNPNWTQAEGEASKIAGYTASNMLTVRVRALDGLGGILDAAVQDGANTLNGVSFDLADPAPVMDEARKAAVADALARARLLADAAGVQLGEIVSINEGGASPNPPSPMYRMEASAVPVAEGEITRSATVTIVFDIADPQ